MAVTNAQELLKHDLGDLLYAEKQILKGLKQMIRETSNPGMRARLEAHHGETEQQVANLERAFAAIGEKPRGQKCPGILGILEEKKEFKEEEEPSKAVLEAFNLGAGLRVEHYEIAAYRSAIALARSVRQSEVEALLTQNLEQELSMAQYIEGASAAALQDAKMMMEREEEAAASSRQRAATRKSATKRSAAKQGGARKGGAAKGAAKKAAARKGGARKGAARKGGRTATRR
jgi:ferritin-like metal-binding protein YciE